MLTHRGQTILEYAIIVGIVVVVLSMMGTGIKRGVQSMVKVTADQVGRQENAEQNFNDASQGYTQVANTQMQTNNSKQITEHGVKPQQGNAVYLKNTEFNESTGMMTNTVTNGGFAPG